MSLNPSHQSGRWTDHWPSKAVSRNHVQGPLEREGVQQVGTWPVLPPQYLLPDDDNNLSLPSPAPTVLEDSHSQPAAAPTFAELERGSPSTENAEVQLIPSPQRCRYRYETSDEVQGRSGALSPGEGILNYVTRDVNSGFACTNTWSDADHAGRTIVSTQYPSPFQGSQILLQMGGGTEVTSTSRCGRHIWPQILSSGNTVRQAALQQAAHLASSSAEHSFYPSSIIFVPQCDMNTAEGNRIHTHWEEMVVRTLMTRAVHFQGDVFEGERLVGSRRYATAFVVLGSHPSSPSAFRTEALPQIINAAINSDLDSHSVPLCRDPHSKLLRSSCYLGTDGGERLVADQANPPAPAFSRGYPMSQRPTLHLCTYVFPSGAEYAEGLLGPATATRPDLM